MIGHHDFQGGEISAFESNLSIRPAYHSCNRFSYNFGKIICKISPKWGVKADRLRLSKTRLRLHIAIEKLVWGT